jgi:hypothetical protein
MDLAFITPDDGWAVGRDVILHWDGTSWANVPHPLFAGTYIWGVVAVSPMDAWAVAQFGYILLGWNGLVDLLRAKSNWLYDLAAVAPDDVWAVGDMIHWNGSAGTKSRTRFAMAMARSPRWPPTTSGRSTGSAASPNGTARPGHGAPAPSPTT